MAKLITLDVYFNKLGKELFSDWSDETVYYFSERKKDLTYLREHALKTYKKAINQIWEDGKVKISVRLEQGYIDPPFAIEEFDFAHSGCITKSGYYRCMLEPFKKETRGRRKLYDLDDIIRDYVVKNYISIGRPLNEIKGESVIKYVEEFLTKQSSKIPHDNTVRNSLKKLYRIN